MKKLFLVVLVANMLLSCADEKLPYYHSATFTPLWEGEQDFSKDTLHRIDAFEFLDQHGQRVSNKTLEGKIYVANFFFTACPGICPRMTNKLMKVQQVFAGRNDVMLLSHTVMPWADSVARLNDFATLYDINYHQWKLLTGKQSEIYALARRAYFAEEVAGYNRDSTDFVHTEHCLLVDQEGHLRGVYNGTLALEVDRMIEDIKILID